MDIPDIQLVVQYKATCNLCTLWQWFGQAAHGAEWDATAILLVEKKRPSSQSKACCREEGKK